jgi:hypothetical protein
MRESPKKITAIKAGGPTGWPHPILQTPLTEWFWRYAMKVVGLTTLFAAAMGCGRVTGGPGISTSERDKIANIAKGAVASNDTWADSATYKVERVGKGWEVTAWRIAGHDVLGRRLFEQGGFRVIKIDDHGNVTNYYRGY